jgi:GH18 family chitinase
VPWLYNADTGIMISYEDPESLTAKADFVLSNQFGGIMIWELAADDDQDTLVNAIAAALPYVFRNRSWWSRGGSNP